LTATSRSLRNAPS
jgi:Bac_Flav_CT_K: Bacteroides conjugative transposon TraK protein